MAIKQKAIDRQRRLIEIGIIRTGDPKPNEKQPGRPRTTFRFTSRNKFMLSMVQKVYGGAIIPMEGRPGEWDLSTPQGVIKALISTVPVGTEGDLESISSFYERWAGNTCTHRCDGETCQVWRPAENPGKYDPKSVRVPVPCECNPEKRACAMTTRLSVILTEIPSIGLWRINTGSKTFESECRALIETLERMGIVGLVPVTLQLEMRERRTGPNEPTSKYPVIRIELDPDPTPMSALVQGIRNQALAPAIGMGDVPVHRGQALASGAQPLAASNPQHEAKQPKYPGSGEYLKSLGLEPEEVKEFKAKCQEAEREWGEIALAAQRESVTAEQAEGAGLTAHEMLMQFTNFYVSQKTAVVGMVDSQETTQPPLIDEPVDAEFTEESDDAPASKH